MGRTVRRCRAGYQDHPRLVQVVEREQEAVGNPDPAPERTLHPRQQQAAEQQLLSEDCVEHDEGDLDGVPDPELPDINALPASDWTTAAKSGPRASLPARGVRWTG